MTDHNIERALGRIEGKIDGLIEDRKEDKTRLDNHGGRIGSLERWQARVFGIAAAIGIVVGFAMKLIKV